MSSHERPIPMSLPAHSEILEREPQLTADEYEDYKRNCELKMRLTELELTSFSDELRKLHTDYQSWKTESGKGRTDALYEQELEVLDNAIKKARGEHDELHMQGDLFPVIRDQDQPGTHIIVEDALRSLFAATQAIRLRFSHLYAMGSKLAPVMKTPQGTHQFSPGQSSLKDILAPYSRVAITPIETEKVYSSSLELPVSLMRSDYLVNSGTAANQLALSAALELSGAYGNDILLAKNMYWETEQVLGDQLHRSMRGESARFAETTDAFVNEIKRHTPSLIYIEPIANETSMTTYDVRKILDTVAATIGKGQKVYVVIDYTVEGPLFDAKSIVENLPKNVIVAFTTSLQKMYQYGNDATTGGMLTVAGHPGQSEFDSFCNKVHNKRSRGFNLTPHQVTLLRHYDPELTREYASLIARNTYELARHVERVISEAPASHCDVSAVLDDSASRSPFFFILFDQSADADRFSKIFSAKARFEEDDTGFGTSFGYRDTRIECKGAAVRIMPGIENPREIHALKRVFEKTLMEMNRS